MNVTLGVLLIASAISPRNAFADAISLDAIVHDYALREHFMGTVLVARGSDVLLRKGYGFSDRAGGAANGVMTRYEVASVTKLFTATAIFQLREQGMLRLEDYVAMYVPSWPRQFSGVTISELLTHTSGLPDTPFPRSCTMAEILPELSRARPEFAPGRGQRYNNTAFRILGAVIARIAKQSYGDYLKRRIFAPLQMHDTGFDAIGPTAVGHHWSRGRFAEVKNDVVCREDSAAGLQTTVDDLYRFDRGLSSRTILGNESMRVMFTKIAGEHAYGWRVGTRYGRRYEEHGGIISGFASDFTRYPDEDACIIVLGNAQGEDARTLSNRLAAALFDDARNEPPIPGNETIEDRH
ncbi:MAG TPA: serine hydrolase domain-containing protein [Elusimicrobiota bacterium]|nr:serine hydrolase domain-containing protein [Elusimicrobiota bacterium]